MSRTLKIIRWTPRILCILAILFISMFALDAFDSRYTLMQQLTAFAIHLVPSYFLIIFLVVSWRWELAGGIAFLVIGLGFTPFIWRHNFDMNHSFWITLSIVLMINLPFILTGGLFILSHFLHKKNSRALP